MAQLKKLGIRSEHSTKEDIPMANKQIERWQTSSFNKEIQIKCKLPEIPIRMVKIYTRDNVMW